MTDDELQAELQWKWATTGYIDPRMDPEAKSVCRQVSYEMHVEDQQYEALTNHLINDHGVSIWQLPERRWKGHDALHAEGDCGHQHDGSEPW